MENSKSLSVYLKRAELGDHENDIHVFMIHTLANEDFIFIDYFYEDAYLSENRVYKNRNIKCESYTIVQ